MLNIYLSNQTREKQFCSLVLGSLALGRNLHQLCPQDCWCSELAYKGHLNRPLFKQSEALCLKTKALVLMPRKIAKGHFLFSPLTKVK